MNVQIALPVTMQTFQLDPAAQLELILDALNLGRSMADLERLAVELSRVAGQKPPWTKKYVHSVLKGRLAPSPRFVAAVMTLGQVVDGVPPGVAGAELVQVYAPPGAVPAGAYIPANVKVLKCFRPECPVWFVRTHPAQKYHDPGCSPSYRSQHK